MYFGMGKKRALEWCYLEISESRLGVVLTVYVASFFNDKAVLARTKESSLPGP